MTPAYLYYTITLRTYWIQAFGKSANPSFFPVVITAYFLFVMIIFGRK